MRRLRRIALLLSLAAAVWMLVPGCAVNPVTGKRELSLVSPQQELALGQEGYTAATAEYGVYDDAAMQQYVNEVGQKVARASHLPSLAWHFTVLDDPTVNAFAMPGGYIYITRGILAHLNSEAQLAGVLGHEIGHVTHRHTAEQMTQQSLYGLGLGLAAAVSPTVAKYSDLAQQGLGLLFLKYSRDDERQADELGVQYATAAGYDPREIPSTYAMLKRVSDEAGQRLPGFLSTHPDPGDREVTTANLARAAATGKAGLAVNERGYVQRLDGIVFGNDPRQGYFSGDDYIQPVMRFRMSFPAGWQHQDSRSAVVAQATDKSAVMQLTVAAEAKGSPAERVAQLQAKGTVTGAQGRAETVGGAPAWIGRVTLPGQQGAAVEAVAGFIRRDTTMFEVLGRSAQAGDAKETLILASMRSFRTLTDAALLHPTPDRVKVYKVAQVGTLEATLQKLGAPASQLQTDAILNDLETDGTVMAGNLLKVVVPGKR
jgi:predicted Zn-dependent protease